VPALKRIVASPAFQGAVGVTAAWYLRLVWRSSAVTIEPSTIYETVETPAIIAMWHGQHFLMPFLKRADEDHRTKVLISRHRDGEINARAAERLGIGTIRGSGSHTGEFHRKGGATAFNNMLTALADELDNWDRSAINLPFSRVAMVASEPIRVSADADDAALEIARQSVEETLNRVTARAYQIVDRVAGATP
jgi:hypothetical protein